MKVQIHGLNELHKALQEFPAQVERNILRGGLRAGARVIADEAKRLVPVIDGDLRDSVRVSVRSSSRTGKVSAQIKSGNKKIWYASFVEFGTARHYIRVNPDVRPQRITRRGDVRIMTLNGMNKAAKRQGLVIGGRFVGDEVVHPGSRPRPFMRPALDSKWMAAIQAMADYIRARLPKEAAKFNKGPSDE